MEVAKEVIMSMKQPKKAQAGYGLQKESEALVKHILLNMVKSSLPEMRPDVKNEEDCIRYREDGKTFMSVAHKSLKMKNKRVDGNFKILLNNETPNYIFRYK